MIPKDWKISKLKDLGTILKGKGILKAEVTPEGKPCIRYGEIYTTYDKYFTQTVSFINDETAKNSQLVKKGDILFAGSGETAEEIGKCTAYIGSEAIYAGGDIIILRPSKDNSVFLAYILNSEKVNKQKSILGQGHSVVHIYPKGIAEIEIALPPLKEQDYIAEILMTCNKAIDKTGDLISKKESKKKVFVHDLFSGIVRFKEFKNSNWNEAPLSEAAWFQEGPGLRTWQFTKQGIKAINITNIVDGVLNLAKTDRHISIEEFNKTYKHFEIQAGDIVVASSGNSYCKHGIVRECDLPLIMNTSVIRFKPLTGCDYNYLNQFLKSPFLKQQIDVLITGGAQPNFGPIHLAEITMPLPAIKEQEKIASVLTTMDDEIQKLKIQLEKLNLQKKGLMQDLLTGKIRVKTKK